MQRAASVALGWRSTERATVASSMGRTATGFSRPAMRMAPGVKFGGRARARSAMRARRRERDCSVAVSASERAMTSSPVSSARARPPRKRRSGRMVSAPSGLPWSEARRRRPVGRQAGPEPVGLAKSASPPAAKRAGPRCSGQRGDFSSAAVRRGGLSRIVADWRSRGLAVGRSVTTAQRSSAGCTRWTAGPLRVFSRGRPMTAELRPASAGAAGASSGRPRRGD